MNRRASSEDNRQRTQPAAQLSRSEQVKISSQKRKRAVVRRNLIIFFVFLIIALIAGIVISAAFFKVNNITVKNAQSNKQASSYYTNDEIINASGFSVGQNLIIADVSGAQKSIETLLPYIGTAKIKRKLPDTLEITVSDTYAKYAVSSTAGYILFNDNAKVLDDSSATIPASAALVTGVTLTQAAKGAQCVFDDADKYDKLMKLGSLFGEYSITDVTKINLESDTDIRFVVSNRITCILGSMTDAQSKLRLASKTIEAENQKSFVSDLIIDLSSQSKAFVRPDRDKSELLETRESLSEPNTAQTDEN